MNHRIAWGVILGILCPVFWLLGPDLSMPIRFACLLGSSWMLWRACLSESRSAGITLCIVTLLLCMRIAVFGSGGPPFPSFPSLMHLRDAVSERLTLLLPEPQAAFMDGLLTGQQQNIPASIRQDMRLTGLTHILAISGFNITLVLMLLQHLFFFVPKQIRIYPLTLGIVLFTLFTGAGASVVRACFMGILNLLALHLGRPGEVRLLIGWAAAIMLVFNPSELVSDAGFQLSFLAVIGLAECTKHVEPWTTRFPDILGSREALTATIAAQLTAAPWAAFVFGNLPLHSPLLNIVIEPLLPSAMLSGGLALLGSFLWQPLGILLAAPGWLILSFILAVAHLGAGMTPLIIRSLEGQMWLLLLWYGILVFWLWQKQPQSLLDVIITPHAPTRPVTPKAPGGTPEAPAEEVAGGGAIRG